MDLKKYIDTHPDFPKPGILFYDISSLMINKDIWQETINQFSTLVKKHNPEVLAGIESRGFIFASTIAFKLNCEVIMIRKKGKLPGQTISHTYKLEYGEDCLEIQKREDLKNKNVILIDDLLATGGTASAAIELLKKTSVNVSAFLTLIELTNLKGRKNIAVQTESLLSFDE
ncbi:MAG: adenine phosphoribosyltransferase [Pelagibacteraceae bacterium]|nr:adenine phosphoribosyltransferase [Pelagibacteraceae bacterium]